MPVSMAERVREHHTTGCARPNAESPQALSNLRAPADIGTQLRSYRVSRFWYGASSAILR